MAKRTGQYRTKDGLVNYVRGSGAVQPEELDAIGAPRPTWDAKKDRFYPAKGNDPETPLDVNRTPVINFVAGPGAGKSSLAAGVFSYLKFQGLNVELVTEYAKKKVWEKSFDVLSNQAYLLGKQYHSMQILHGQVDAIITDSPLILSELYCDRQSVIDLSWDLWNEFNNKIYFVKREKEYNPIGRVQTEEEAIAMDDKIKKIVVNRKLGFEEVAGNWKSIPEIGEKAADWIRRSQWLYKDGELTKKDYDTNYAF